MADETRHDDAAREQQVGDLPEQTLSADDAHAVKGGGGKRADVFIKLDPKVEGESLDSKHVSEISLG